MPFFAQGPQKNHTFGILQVLLHVVCKEPGHRGGGWAEAINIGPALSSSSGQVPPPPAGDTHSAKNRLLQVYSLSFRLARRK